MEEKFGKRAQLTSAHLSARQMRRRRTESVKQQLRQVYDSEDSDGLSSNLAACETSEDDRGGTSVTPSPECIVR